jgi:formylglycine-generating enzyme required for sulfatase activity
VKQLDNESDVTIRRALILSLGGYGEADFTPEARDALLPKLQTLYRTASDPGLHAACEWLLRRWKQEAWLTQMNEEWAKDKEQRDKRLDVIGKLLAHEKEKTPRQWYVNTQGQTFVVIPGPVEFMMGSPPTEKDRADNETQHQKRIGRTFALAATPVTLEQFGRCFPKSKPTRITCPTCPIIGVTWYEAAAYCNWLNQQEGVAEDQWCYETNPQGQVTRLKENYLSRTGYRLPTEAEWEFACRAGAVTTYSYGAADDLLGKYGWHVGNSDGRLWPVGRKQPNDWGLFDMHGHVWDWCQERYKLYPQAEAGKAFDDVEDFLGINNEDRRVLRGGSRHTSGHRSAARHYRVPTDDLWYFGFRPARTLPFGSFTALPLSAGGGRK